VRSAAADDLDVDSTLDEQASARLEARSAREGADPAPYDRRLYSRRRDGDLDWVRSVRLRAARRVTLVDLSAGGALIDADVPLRPGAELSLEISGRDIETAVTLRVLRSHVAALLADRTRYRGACEFARPLELPGFHALPQLAGTGSDPIGGVDAALKRLVARAYAADASQRLAAGDIGLVLQALARHSFSVADPFGRQIGTLLEELIPALRDSDALNAAVRTIERQLCHVLPHARLRVVRGNAPTPAGMKSVLIKLPGALAGPDTVRVDLPSAAVISDAQARLLRTSSRLLALVHGVNAQPLDEHAPATGAVPAIVPAVPVPPPALEIDADASRTPDGWQKVVVRYADGQMLKGFTADFHGSKSQFTLCPSTAAPSHDRIVVPLARLKAVFFVREFAGNPGHVEQKVFDAPAHGRRIEVTLLDDEVLVGTTLNYRAGSTGFFIHPADPRANNVRVFVVGSAVRQVRFP
jgi:PilZ domain